MLAVKGLGRVAVGTVIGPVVSLVGDALIFWWLWQRSQQPVSSVVAQARAYRRIKRSSASLAVRVRGLLVRAVTVQLISILLFETIEHVSVHWRESSQELVHMGLLAATLAGMVWTA